MKDIVTLLLLMLFVIITGCDKKAGPESEDAKVSVDVKTEDKAAKEVEEPESAVEMKDQTGIEAEPVTDQEEQQPLVTVKQKQADQKVFEAAFNGDIDTVRAALDDNVDSNSQDTERGSTLLMLAAFNGHADVLELLVKRGSELDTQDIAGRTALMYCASGTNIDAVKVLLEAGANVNVTDKEEHFTALMFAAAEGQAEIVKLLLDYNSDLDKTDIDGDTARNFAVQNGHSGVVKIIDDYKKYQSDKE